jgi:hypothetical protein
MKLTKTDWIRLGILILAVLALGYRFFNFDLGHVITAVVTGLAVESGLYFLYRLRGNKSVW